MPGTFLQRLLWLLLCTPAAVPAQDIFVTRGAGGPLFSDKPQQGAKPLTLPPANVIEAIPTTRPNVAQRGGMADNMDPRQTAAPYRQFSIVFPENGGSVAVGAAILEVRMAIDPNLQVGEGHAISISIDGRNVGQHFTASAFTIPPEFWGNTSLPINQLHRLDAEVLDRQGTVLQRATPVNFRIRPVYILPHRPSASSREANPPRPATSAPLFRFRHVAPTEQR